MYFVYQNWFNCGWYYHIFFRNPFSAISRGSNIISGIVQVQGTSGSTTTEQWLTKQSIIQSLENFINGIINSIIRALNKYKCKYIYIYIKIYNNTFLWRNEKKSYFQNVYIFAHFFIFLFFTSNIIFLFLNDK